MIVCRDTVCHFQVAMMYRLKISDLQIREDRGFSLIAYPDNGIPSGYIVRDIRGEYLGFANNKKQVVCF